MHRDAAGRSDRLIDGPARHYIQIDHKALEEVGIGTDTPVTRNLKGITLRGLLRLMLKEMDLTYVVRDEVLLITTPEECECGLFSRIFPIADLVPLDGPDESLEVEARELGSENLIEVVVSTVRPTTWEEVGGPGAIELYQGCLYPQTQDVLDETTPLFSASRKVQALAKATPDIRRDRDRRPR